MAQAVKQRAKKVMPVSPGRPKGVPNRTTTTLKDAIILAAQAVGNDGAGKEGLTGYLTMVAKTDVKAFAGLLGRVLPLQIAGGGEGGGIIIQVMKLSADNPDPQ